MNNLEKNNENKLSNEFNGIPIKDNKIIEPEKIVRILNIYIKYINKNYNI
jgi:hypothetical protein